MNKKRRPNLIEFIVWPRAVVENLHDEIKVKVSNSTNEVLEVSVRIVKQRKVSKS